MTHTMRLMKERMLYFKLSMH